jgi:YVTN family beta-propeller protein
MKAIKNIRLFTLGLSIFSMFVFIEHSEALTLKKVISGNIAAKSVVHSGTGLFFAQNMMYRHSVTVYNRDYELIKTISDRVKLTDYGHTQYKGEYQGSPVEIAFSRDGRYAWVSNYQMYGSGFDRPGNDTCTPEGKHDHSYVFQINTETFAIEQVIKVGAVPKFLAVTPDGRFVLVANWCSWDISVIDTAAHQVIRHIYVGRYPRGLAVTADSKKVYIAVMGSYDIAVMDLESFSLSWLKGIGRSPRHLNLSPDNKFLYATLNGEGMVAKVDTESGKLVKKVFSGYQPRSMAISGDGTFLYVVNYKTDSISKITTETMEIAQTVKVNHLPIGITYDDQTKQVWVSCYSGTIMVFQD